MKCAAALNEMYENLAERNQDFLRTNSRLKEELAFHRQAEMQLRKLSLAVERSPASTFITDAKGVFEYVNPKFVEVTGYSMSDVAGKTPRILKSGDVPDEAYAEFWRSIAGKAEWFEQFHNRRKNGELYWDKVSVTPIADADGTVTHYLAIQEDVTARKQAEEELHHSHAQLLASLSELQEQSEDLSRLNQASELLQTCVTEAEASRVVAHVAEKLHARLPAAPWPWPMRRTARSGPWRRGARAPTCSSRSAATPAGACAAASRTR